MKQLAPSEMDPLLQMRLSKSLVVQRSAFDPKVLELSELDGHFLLCLTCFQS